MDTETFYPKNRGEWREWLQQNHQIKPSVWLIYYKKKSDKPTILYSEAVEEALCFGWIDSKAKSVDDERTMQYFTKRKPDSIWSMLNKSRIQNLIEEERMTQAGLEVVERAKADGSWTILDDVEALMLPPDLEIAFLDKPQAMDYFLGWSKSVKKSILLWLKLAKREETRQKRIAELVELAGQGQKPKQFS